jgi:hypothetical protein
VDEPPETLDAAPLPLSLAEAERIIALLEDVVRERSVVLIGSSLLLHIDELSIAEAVDGADWLAVTAGGGSARGR